MKPRLSGMDRRRGAGCCALSAPASAPAPSATRLPAEARSRPRLHVRRRHPLRAGTATECRPRFRTRPGARDVARPASRQADRSDQSGASNDNGSTSPAGAGATCRKTGEAAARTSPPRPPDGDHGGHGHGGVIVAGYPWWSSGYYGGYYAYDPWLGWYPTYDTTSSGGERCNGRGAPEGQAGGSVCLRGRLLRRRRGRFRRRLPAAPPRTGTAPSGNPSARSTTTCRST